MNNIFNSPQKLYEALNNNGYICDKDIPLIIYLTLASTHFIIIIIYNAKQWFSFFCGK